MFKVIDFLFLKGSSEIMKSDIIRGIVYSENDDVFGPNSVCWDSLELSEDTINLISFKSITFLGTEQGFTPTSLVLIPFPSLKLKGIIKYIEIKEEIRRGGVDQSAITLVFREEDDAIFYKHLKNIEGLFNDTANKILELELSERSEEKILGEIKKLQIKLSDVFDHLRIQENSGNNSEAFPELENLPSYQFKIIICGDPSVGKTSISLRYTESAFSRTYIPTLGVNVSEKKLIIDNTRIQLIFWDIAGQSKFGTLRKHFYAGSDGVILVFDLTNLDSINSINQWYKDIKKNIGRESRLTGLIFGNKKDLIDNIKVPKENAISLANELKLDYFESSALTGENINEGFYKLAKDLLSLK